MAAWPIANPSPSTNAQAATDRVVMAFADGPAGRQVGRLDPTVTAVSHAGLATGPLGARRLTAPAFAGPVGPTTANRIDAAGAAADQNRSRKLCFGRRRGRAIWGASFPPPAKTRTGSTDRTSVPPKSGVRTAIRSVCSSCCGRRRPPTTPSRRNRWDGTRVRSAPCITGRCGVASRAYASVEASAPTAPPLRSVATVRGCPGFVSISWRVLDRQRRPVT